MASAPTPFQDLVCIGTAGDIFMCDEFGSWIDFGMLGGWPLAMVGTDPQGNLYGVGLDGFMDFWNPGAKGWTNSHAGGGGGYSAPSGWNNGIVQFLYGPNGTMWVVSPSGQIGMATPEAEFADQSAMDSWTVKMLVYDSFGTMWCVGTQGNIGQWYPTTNVWSDYTMAFGNWSFNGLFYDRQGISWGIGTEGNVGQTLGVWTDHGLLGGKQMRWLYWPVPGSFPLPA
ncbi:MAG: hypothetical protein QOH04_2621 [Sphingomonadales bacterium]|jgi:hypothetical protein|nr:hypothetical protein [Sphingomonadales bacterium]MEA3036844.1 hypothetical protein [Sphingomonadales bacterium]